MGMTNPRLTTIVVATACLLLLSRSDANAQIFGDSGTFAPGGALELSRSGESGENTTSTNLALGPQLYYFVLDDLAIGVSLTYVESAGEHIDYWRRVGIAPAVAYNFRFTDSISLFPSASAGISYRSSRLSLIGPGNALLMEDSASEIAYSAEILLPLLVHVGNFHVGFGPYVRLSKADIDRTVVSYDPSVPGSYREDTSSHDSRSSDWVVGVRSMIGGWF